MVTRENSQNAELPHLLVNEPITSEKDSLDSSIFRLSWRQLGLELSMCSPQESPHLTSTGG